MIRLAQVGIAVGALGVVLTLMGLFPGVTGLEPASGIGTVQIFIILVGFALLIFGALVYVKSTFYSHAHGTLAQQIGVRLAMTGLLFAAMTGLADPLGFGSHLRTENSDTFFGIWQAAGVIGGFMIASLGVVLYAVSGKLEDE
jgi:hypothetical protein